MESAAAEVAVEVDAHHLVASLACELGDEAAVDAATMTATRALVDALFALPVERSAVGPIARLPPPTSNLPRAKPCPQPKAPTKWDDFAKAKGIQKKKKSRMEWDDEKREFAPAWGYKRGDNVEDRPIIEVKATAAPDYDPRIEAREAKKARVAKNEKRRTANEDRALPPSKREEKKRKAAEAAIAAGVAVDVETVAGPVAPGGSKKRQRGKEAVEGALGKAQRSTASLGKFDAKRAGEKARASATAGRKRAFAPNVPTARGADSRRYLALMDDLKKPRAVAPKKGQKERMDTHDGELPVDFKRKKGRAAGGKVTKVTKRRAH